MNERIKELYEQAHDEKPLVTLDPETFEQIHHDKTYRILNPEKFAELIIQECIDLVNKERRNMSHLLSNPPQNGGIFDAMNSIRYHFGMFKP